MAEQNRKPCLGALVSLQRSHLFLRPAGSSDGLLARAGGESREERAAEEKAGVPWESELDAEWLVGGKRNPTAESQLRLLTEGKNEKRKIPSAQHHASPAAL